VSYSNKLGLYFVLITRYSRSKSKNKQFKKPGSNYSITHNVVL
jgi:hypothetical protein